MATKKYPKGVFMDIPEFKTAREFIENGHLKGGDNNASYWKTEKFKAALNSSPNIVVIELGTNDSKLFFFTYYNVTVDMLKPSYVDLLDTFAHLPTNPEIYATLQPYSNNVEWGIMDTSIVKYINPLIKETAIEKGVNIIDLHTLFKTPDWFTGTKTAS